LCAASSGVDDDRVDTGALERGDVALRERRSVILRADVRMKRAAADLSWCIDDGDPEAREHPGRRRMDVAIRDAHHAPEEERDARDRCGWRRRRVIARASERRIQTLETTEPRRQSIA